MGLVTLIFDLLTLKLVRESHRRWGTFFPNLGTLGLWFQELVAICTRQTDGQTGKSKPYCPHPMGGRIKTAKHAMHAHEKRNARKDRIGCMRALRILVF